MQWYVSRDGCQHGPISQAELELLVKLKHLKPADLLWNASLPAWREARLLLELAEPVNLTESQSLAASPLAPPFPAAPRPVSLPLAKAPATPVAVVPKGSKIFISYSKPDVADVIKLAALLEGHGYEVWWDTNLAAGDDFQSEIHQELIEADCVVVLWSPASIKSTWVRAEATAAQDAGKLVPLRLSKLGGDAIPPPFNLLQAEDVSKSERVVTAVAARLTKTPDKPSLGSLYRYELMSWLGIVGIAATILAAIDPIIELANWARFILENWRYWSHLIWAFLLSWINIPLPPGLEVYLSITAFLCWTATSSRIRARWLARVKPVQAALVRQRVPIINMIGLIVMLYLILVVGQVNIFGFFPNRGYANQSLLETLFLWSLGFSTLFVVVVANRFLFIRNLLSAIALLTIFIALNYLSLYADQVRSVVRPKFAVLHEVGTTSKSWRTHAVPVQREGWRA